MCLEQNVSESSCIFPNLVNVLGLCWFDPAALHSILPAVCTSDWRTGAWEASGLNFPQGQSAEGSEVPRNKEPPLEVLRWILAFSVFCSGASARPVLFSLCHRKLQRQMSLDDWFVWSTG